MKKILRFSIVLAAIVLGTSAWAAAPVQFTDGNLVIFRMGPQTGGLTNAGTVVFLDEYTTNGTPVQSVMMPTNYFGAYSPLLANGTTFGSGLITRSVDGRFILVGGFGARVGQLNVSLSTQNASDVPRVIALVDGVGNVDSTTTLTNSASDGLEPRTAVTTNGTDIWFGGASTIQYTTLGSILGTRLFSLNTRQLQVYSNQLYLTSVSLGSLSPAKIGEIAIVTNAFGTTLPNATNSIGLLDFCPATTNMSPGPSGAEGFAAFHLKTGGSDPIDTLYILDSGSLTAGAAKFSLVSGNWVYNGFIPTVQSLVGLAANVITNGSITNVNLYLSGGGATLTGGDAVYKVTDNTGWNGDVSGNPGVFLPFIAAVPNGQALRGLVFAPSTNSALALPSGPGQLSVGPAIDVFASALLGCPDVTETDVYSVANPGTSSIGWTASVDSNWVALSSNSGTLNSMDSANVTVSLNNNVTSLTAATNTAMITFSNTVSGAVTTRAVTLFTHPFEINPTTDYLPAGQPGGPFTPSNKVYTVIAGSGGIDLRMSQSTNWLNFIVGTTTSTALSVSIGSCSSTSITVAANQIILTNKTVFPAGNYLDIITFSNANTATVLDTRNANLTVGGLFFCDDFSTFVQNADLEGQQGWTATSGNPTIQVHDNAAWQPGATTANDEPYKNIPLTSNGYVYAAMSIIYTSAPPSTVDPVYGPAFWQGQNVLPSARFEYELSAHASDAGNTQFVFGARINNCGPWGYGTQALNYNQQYRVILRAAAIGSSNQVVWVNPSSATENTNTAYKVLINNGNYCRNDGLGSFQFGGQYTTAANPSPGYAVYKLCITTSYADAYNDLLTVGPPDPFTTWQNFYFGITTGNAASGADPDNDGMINTNEFLAGFNPTNNAAYLHIINVAKTNTNDIVVRYLGANGDTSYTGGPTSRTNVLEFTLGTGNGSYTSTNFVPIGAGGTNILNGGTGTGAIASFVDTNGASGATKYYRVRVLVP